MNVSSLNNKSFLHTDYKNIEEKIAVTLPIVGEEENQELMSDENRELLVGYMGYKSKVDQVNIYLRGSTNGKVGYDGVLPGIVAFNDMQNRMRISDVYA